jgi:hypothetical protein
MIEIELPCCDTIARVEALEDTIRCESCGIELEVGDDDLLPVLAAA